MKPASCCETGWSTDSADGPAVIESKCTCTYAAFRRYQVSMKTVLKDRVVAITGGARGIGLATAKAFIAAGAKVAIGDLDADLAKQVAAGISGDMVALPLDVTSPQSFATFLDDAERVLGPLDILVNNAGVMLTGEFVAESRAAEDRMVDINLRGVILGCKLGAQRFMKREGGRVIN